MLHVVAKIKVYRVVIVCSESDKTFSNASDDWKCVPNGEGYSRIVFKSTRKCTICCFVNNKSR